MMDMKYVWMILGIHVKIVQNYYQKNYGRNVCERIIEIFHTTIWIKNTLKKCLKITSCNLNSEDEDKLWEGTGIEDH